MSGKDKAKLIFWLLPIVDIVTVEKVLSYYRSLEVEISVKHARIATVERLLGYLPAGFIASWVIGFWYAILIFFLVFAAFGPLELYLMVRGVRPWGFFKGISKDVIAKIFLLESYNIIGYLLLGMMLAWLLLQ
ncbi:MAG: hypothetical protein QMD22_08995 [archaeon]|nr:hypothetical protein [archaeon]